MASSPNPRRVPEHGQRGSIWGLAVNRLFAVTLALGFVWGSECLAKTTSIQVGWDAARAIQTHGDFRGGVRIWLKSGQRLKGSITGFDQSGLALRREGIEVRIARKDVRSIRFVPRRAATRKHRILAIVGGIPVGIAAGLGVVALCCGPNRSSSLAVFHSTWAGIQYLLFRIGSRADLGELVVVIDEPPLEKPNRGGSLGPTNR